MKAPSPKNYDGMQKTEKILSLQEQLLNFRKQMSKKQSQWQKQRSNLISKNEVANIQIAELKQRIVNLSKINQTLTLAMTNQSDDKYDLKIKKPKPLTFGQDASDSSRDSPNAAKQAKTKAKGAEEIKKLNRIINQKDFQINNLTKIGSQVRSKLEQKNRVVSSMEETCFHMKRKIQKQQQEILKLHKQIQQLQLHIQQMNAEETRRNNAYHIQNQNKYMEQSNSYEDQQVHGKKYSKNSSYLIMRPTPDHSGSDPDITYFNEINYTQEGQNSEQEEKLLCEVCNRVYSFGQFQEHAKYCGKNGKKPFPKGLYERKKVIEQRLNLICNEEIKQNLKGRYHQQKFFEGEDYAPNRDKINQIRQIAKGLASTRDLKKAPFNDFTIKSNGYYF